jgi:hypothetical protein
MIQDIIVTALVIVAGGYILYRLTRHGGSVIGCSGCTGCKLKDTCEIPDEERPECPEQKTHTQE